MSFFCSIKRQQQQQQQQQQSPSNSMSPSVTSMQQNFNNSPTNFHEFGASPLTIDANDQIPLAIALQETIHVMISGDNKEKYEKNKKKKNYFNYFFLF